MTDRVEGAFICNCAADVVLRIGAIEDCAGKQGLDFLCEPEIHLSIRMKLVVQSSEKSVRVLREIAACICVGEKVDLAENRR